MPYPPRRIVPGLTRQANPTRGARLFVSGRSSAFGNVPEKGPVPPEMTGTAAVKSGATSRLTIWPPRSTNGHINSYRSPRLNVSVEVFRQSSCKYALIDLPDMRTSPGPYCTVACCGMPSRKSAKSSPPPRTTGEPPDAYRPVKTNAPRAFESVRLLDSSRRTSPPRRSVCFVNGRVHPYARLTRVSVRRVGVMSRTLVRLENESCGTPQSNGSVDTPPIPAAPQIGTA